MTRRTEGGAFRRISEGKGHGAGLRRAFTPAAPHFEIGRFDVPRVACRVAERRARETAPQFRAELREPGKVAGELCRDVDVLIDGVCGQVRQVDVTEVAETAALAEHLPRQR